MTHKLGFVTGLMVAGTLACIAQAQSPKSEQASARPGNLPLVSPVMQATSDQRSKQFQSAWLPALKAVAAQNLGEGKKLAKYELFQLDPERLFLIKPTPVRVYYVDGVSGNQNAMGFSFTLAGAQSPGNQQLVFPSTANPTYHRKWWLSEGDFVDLGLTGAGTRLDLFMIVNGGANQDVYRWYADINRNKDRLSHLVTFSIPDSPFLLIGFDDAPGGGDRDFNDLVIAVDIGIENKNWLVEEVRLPN